MTEEVSIPKYRMTVDLNVLDHLGINLYSNISAVLTEAVANAWDADAKEVRIKIDVEDNHDLVEISDDGIGMTVQDMNEKYLRVGYRRRTTGPDTTPGGRPVMGRKGLGKLSLFSIANEIEIQSAKDSEYHGLTMKVDDIRRSVEQSKNDYAPGPLDVSKIIVTQGTLIRLHKIKRPRLSRSMAALRMQLARRFSVIGETHKFKVFLNDSMISIDDRGELKAAQFLWQFGETKIPLPEKHQIVEQNTLVDSDELWDDSCKVTGWLATSRFPKDLETDAGNLNAIVVLARGRLIQENILDKLNDGRIFTKYLTGQIEADFLDISAENDIATSDRQRLQEDDQRYLKLLKFLKSQLSVIESKWNEFRKKHEVEKAKSEAPALKEWFDGLQPGFKKSAEKMIAQISALPIEKKEDKKELLKHGIIAFERMKLRGSTEEFAQGILDIEKLLTLLADRDSLEASLYRDIVKSRLEALKDFCKIVDDNDKEKVLQKYLFEHLWLLDPTWERATGSERIEEALAKEFKEFAKNLTDEESKGRLDIRYKTSAGKHMIVELKRVKRLMSLPELMEQGQKYKSALHKCLTEQGETIIEIEIVFVLGKTVAEASNPAFGSTHVAQSIAPLNARVVYYNEMIENAKKSYSEHLEQSKAVDRLEKLLLGL
jgi:hypothetical protein